MKEIIKMLYKVFIYYHHFTNTSQSITLLFTCSALANSSQPNSENELGLGGIVSIYIYLNYIKSPSN